MKHQPHHRSPLSLILNLFHHEPTSQTNPDFLNSLIHELKTPLSAIISFSEMLQADINNPNAAADCADYAKEINQTALGLNELINDLLDVGSIRSGNFSVDLTKEIDVAKVIEKSIRLNYGYALKRNISIKTTIEEGLKTIKLDEKRLKQILVNLISNSLKYSPKNSEITIEAKTQRVTTSESVIIPNDTLIITITDNGFGMTQNQVTRAFEKYQTIKNPNSGIVDSFGLGLPIVKELVQLQKGEIAMESEVGKGTKVEMRFSY
jgi:signal transduction histidine kinase